MEKLEAKDIKVGQTMLLDEYGSLSKCEVIESKSTQEIEATIAKRGRKTTFKGFRIWVIVIRKPNGTITTLKGPADTKHMVA